MTKEEFIRLLSKDCLSEEEKLSIRRYVADHDDAKYLLESLYEKDIKERATIDETTSERLKNKIADAVFQGQSTSILKKHFWSFGRVAAVLAVVLTLAGSIFIFHPFENKKDKTAITTKPHSSKDIQPGSVGATLMMADGRVMVLDSAGNGVIANADGSIIRKNADGSIMYENQTGNAGKVSMNKLSTPIGRTFKVVLPDGSLAYLNAGSSLSYPTAFIGTERNVEMNGEVYFEVKHDASKPFKVHVMSGQKEESLIRVLGTHFNIKAYDDESSTQTTLCQGSIQYSTANIARILVPGDQLEKNRNANTFRQHKVDIDEVTAWVNGDFNFHNASIQDIMQQIARWYGVQVTFKRNLSDMQFDGVISRNNSLQKVMKILELGGIKYQLEGNQIIVQ